MADSKAASILPTVAAAPSEDGQWVMPPKNFANTRYSALEAINIQNVANLKVAFTFSIGVNRGQESSPIVIGSTLYVVSPFPNKLYALDLSKPGAPAKWTFDPKPDLSAQGVACCDVVNRGPTSSNGRIFYNTLDGFTVAVSAEDGKEVWRTKLADINLGESMTMAPLAAKGKIIVGNSGGEMGVRGWIAALDEVTGKLLWKAFNTGPIRRF
jgi:glucose dehydrogenase